MAKGKAKKITKIVINSLLGVIAGLAVIIMGLSIVSKTTNKFIFNTNITWVMTNSMEPTIPQQSYILIEKVDGNDVKVGDVITFVVKDGNSSINGQYNTHRVIEITADNRLITKGDNPSYPQDVVPVDRADVVAIYKKNLPVASAIGRLFVTPLGYVLTVMVIAGTCIIWFTIDIKDKKKASDKENFDKLVEEEVKRLEQEAKDKKIN